MNEVHDVNRYDDIINLPHHVSTKHPHMSLYDRAAQFSPFAALTGHDEAIHETARLTDKKLELNEDAKTRLNEKLQIIFENNRAETKVTITYFVPDERKNGGEYISYTGNIKKIDEYKRAIVMMDKSIIPIEQIMEIDSDIFNFIE